MNDALEGFFQILHRPLNPGGPTVGTVGGIVALIQLGEHVANLLTGEALIGPDAMVAGYHHATFVQHLFQTGFQADVGGPFRQLDDNLSHIAVIEQRRHRFDHKGVPAEGFQLQSPVVERRDELLQDLGLGKPHLHGFGHQQPLGFNPAGPSLELFIDDAFMGGMLVDENETLGTLANDISAVKLPDDHKVGKAILLP